ncbi:sterol regulatory element-binding protein cleavage-activating protein [Schistocerca nitens]|uniref:sterol regulatory element-binding protein cleavage-activating protein n=1 Tax=Schistocerca nitens TaxID=7011 RepID=UPI002118FF76|nr:sterol regulatory element-binding protein cleavage-activating protein [Schistocerca nitens]
MATSVSPPDGPAHVNSHSHQRSSTRVSLPEKVSQLYYAHGLFCASHQWLVLGFAAIVVLLCCYPLLSLPLPGNVPQALVGNKTFISSNVQAPLSSSQQNSELPRWFSGTPLLYVHQVIVRSAVCPWADDLVLADGFRAPLGEAFRLLDAVRDYHHENNSLTLSDVCLHVESAVALAPEHRSMVPEFGCLVLSPAGLWHHDPGRYAKDPAPLRTVFTYQGVQHGKVSLSEVLLGHCVKDTGVKRYPLRSRQRVLQYALTLFLRVHSQEFLDGLHQRLRRLYPLHQGGVQNLDTTYKNENNLLHVYYPGKFSARAVAPLIATLVAIFVYVYFSLRKVELIKSKLGIAFAVVITVLASLLMSVGLCFSFGLTLSMSGRDYYPYLVVIVGLENVIILTKSIVSTPPHLDAKIRVAQGLSREGWSITKNLLTEVTILTFGLFTLVPAIQEFCIFAVVALLSDFFLQVVFFSTVLAADIRRADLSGLDGSSGVSSTPYTAAVSRSSFLSADVGDSVAGRRSGLHRSRSHPRLESTSASYPASIVAPPLGRTYNSAAVLIPKRLRVVHFWARTRIVQRGFMVFMVVWIAAIVYDSGIIEQLLPDGGGTTWHPTDSVSDFSVENKQKTVENSVYDGPEKRAIPPLLTDSKDKGSNGGNHYSNGNSNGGSILSGLPCQKLLPQPSRWEPVVSVKEARRWQAALQLYNISVSGHYITVLPPLHLLAPVSPQAARIARHPDDIPGSLSPGSSGSGPPGWETLAAALDSGDFDLNSADLRHDGSASSASHQSSAPLVPQSPTELFLTAVLCAVSVAVIAYTTAVLYRCVCSRNYAEWRAGWSGEGSGAANEGDTQVFLRESVPLALEGHTQQVEWIVADGGIIVSCCFGGELRSWDGLSGELLAFTDRARFFSHPPILRSCSEEGTHSDYESGSPPSRGDEPSSVITPLPGNQVLPSFPDLRHAISANFTSASHQQLSVVAPPDPRTGFDYGERYRLLFEEFISQQRKKNERTTDFPVLQENCSFRPPLSNPTPIPGSTLHRTLPSAEPPSPVSPHSASPSTVSSRPPPPVWCLDCRDNLVAAGCADGRLEFWEANTGAFKCLFDDGSGVAVTAVKVIGNRVVAARLNGALDFLELETFGKSGKRPLALDGWGFTNFRRTHIRTGSAGSAADMKFIGSSGSAHGNTGQKNESEAVTEEEVRCSRLVQARAHRQPITALDCEGGRVVTGGQDHCMKVFRLEDQRPLYTLHGHCGPITCVFIDRISPLLSGSGSQDGLLCVWDLLTGTCMYSIQAHDGAVLSLTYSASYVISLGSDERLCVWERFQGHLLNTINLSNSYCPSIVMLTHNLLVTSKQDSLIVWDVRTGEPVRVVRLSGGGALVKQLVLLAPGDSVACDCGSQVRVVRFPLACDKTD